MGARRNQGEIADERSLQPAIPSLLTTTGHEALQQVSRTEHRLSEFLHNRSPTREYPIGSSVLLAKLRAHSRLRKIEYDLHWVAGKPAIRLSDELTGFELERASEPEH